MLKTLRVAIEEVSPHHSLASTLGWHPHHAPLAALGEPPPCCYYQFMEWVECVQRGSHAEAAMTRLVRDPNRTECRPAPYQTRWEI